MKRILFIFLILTLTVGCAHKAIMPIMDLPPEPVRPPIKSSVIVQNNTPWISYSLNDSLKLYEYLLKKDSYEEKLRFRIESMNELMKGK